MASTTAMGRLTIDRTVTGGIAAVFLLIGLTGLRFKKFSIFSIIVHAATCMPGGLDAVMGCGVPGSTDAIPVVRPGVAALRKTAPGKGRDAGVGADNRRPGIDPAWV